MNGRIVSTERGAIRYYKNREHLISESEDREEKAVDQVGQVSDSFWP